MVGVLLSLLQTRFHGRQRTEKSKPWGQWVCVNRPTDNRLTCGIKTKTNAKSCFQVLQINLGIYGSSGSPAKLCSGASRALSWLPTVQEYCNLFYMWINAFSILRSWVLPMPNFLKVGACRKVDRVGSACNFPSFPFDVECAFYSSVSSVFDTFYSLYRMERDAFSEPQNGTFSPLGWADKWTSLCVLKGFQGGPITLNKISEVKTIRKQKISFSKPLTLWTLCHRMFYISFLC